MTTPNQINTHNTEPANVDRKLVHYSASDRQTVLLVEKTPGLRLSVAEVTQHATQPLAEDMGGCVYVQTTRGEGDSRVRDQYYINTRGCVDRSNQRGMLLPAGYAEDPMSDITVGEQWQSPFGDTPGTVEAVGMPYVDGSLDEALVESTHPVSPLVRGEMTLGAIPDYAHEPVQLPPQVFTAR